MTLTNSQKRALLLDAIDEVANLKATYSCVAILDAVIGWGDRLCEDHDDSERHGDALAEEYKAWTVETYGSLPVWWDRPTKSYYRERVNYLTAFRNSIPEGV